MTKRIEKILGVRKETSEGRASDPVALLTTKQVAARLQLHQFTILNYVRRGVNCGGSRVFLRASRFGRSYRIGEDALETFLKLTSNFSK